MKRVHLVDVLVCTHCGGASRVLAAIHDPTEVRRVLRSMGLSDEVPGTGGGAVTTTTDASGVRELAELFDFPRMDCSGYSQPAV